MVDIALPSAVALGLIVGLATFFSPCAYPLLPGYVGYYASQAGDGVTLTGSILRGVVAGGGILLTLAALLVGGLYVGETLVDRLLYPGLVVGIVVLVAGVLVALDAVPTWSPALPKRRSSIAGFGLFGAGYAVASVGCIVPIFLGFVAFLVERSAAESMIAVGSYLASVTALMIAFTVAAGTGISLGTERLDVPVGTVKRLAGVVLIVAGLGQIALALVLL